MLPVTRISGIAAPLPFANINTDDIYPGPDASPFLRKYPEHAGSRAAAGANGFAGWRYTDDMVLRDDFVLNRAPYLHASIVLSGPNFGCGSSRELAVWALVQMGIACVIANSFGDIFQDNCVKNGVLPARVADADMARILDAEARTPGAPFTVDLTSETIVAPDSHPVSLVIDRYPRQLLLAGHEEIDAALAQGSAVDKFAVDYRARNPWL